MKVNVILHPEHHYSTWYGGSIVGSLSCFNEMCISKDDYDEYGPEIIHHMCL